MITPVSLYRKILREWWIIDSQSHSDELHAALEVDSESAAPSSNRLSLLACFTPVYRFKVSYEFVRATLLHTGI